MVNRKTKNNKKDNSISGIDFALSVFVLTMIIILFLAYLVSINLNNQQNEISFLENEMTPKITPIKQESFLYYINIAPNFNGEMCSTIVNKSCVLEKVNMTQQNVFEVNDTYYGNYSMSIYINPTSKVSLEVIIDYDNNQTQNILTFNDMTGMNTFSGLQVPSKIKMIFNNEGKTQAVGYVEILETPR